MVDDRFRKFVMDHRIAINDMVTQLWPLVDEHVGKQIQHGFEHCAEPCFRALYRRQDASVLTREKVDACFLTITKLLLAAIKKRYYAFPDKYIVAVDQELLFDSIIPRTIDAGLLDDSTDLLVLLFNAGENLREISRAFFDTMLLLIDVVSKHPNTVRAIIHVAAWLSGDVKRRAHAMPIITGGQLPPAVLPIILFKGKIPATALLDRPIARPLSAVLGAALASDPWLSPDVIKADPDFPKIAEIATSGKPAIPREVEQELAARAAAKSMRRPASIKFLGKGGRYEGFGGTFDSPPIVVGTPSEATAIARTATGRLFHVDYGGTGMRTHVIGTTTCEELVCTRGMGIVARNGDGSIVALQDGKILGTLPRPTGKLIAAGTQDTAFYLDQDANIIHAIDAGGSKTSHDVLSDDTITAMAAITDDRLAIVSCDHEKRKWALHEISTGGKLKKIAGLPGWSLVATCDQTIACLQPDGKIRIVDARDGTEIFVATSIDPASATSFHVTPREIITTHAFTYAIHFHGPPV